MSRRLVPTLIPEAIAGAVRAFGLVDPVTVQLEELSHREHCTEDSELSAFYRREDGAHLIVVHSDQTPQAISKAIYHELTHASQCEREFNGDGPRFHATTFFEGAMNELSGLGSALEEEAEAAELFDYDLRLARMVKR